MRGLALLALTAGVALRVGGAGNPAIRGEDYADVALNVLAPGQSGNLNIDRNSTDQLRLLDALTPREATPERIRFSGGRDEEHDASRTGRPSSRS